MNNVQFIVHSGRKGKTMYKIGDRVIFQCPAPELDGRRGQIETVLEGGVYGVRFDDGPLWEIWESKLAREADEPDYPLPEKA